MMTLGQLLLLDELAAELHRTLHQAGLQQSADRVDEFRLRLNKLVPPRFHSLQTEWTPPAEEPEP